MAQKVIETLIDDIDGSDADETITFSFEGVEYRIDLNQKNADKFRKVVAPFVDSAQRIGGRSRRAGAGRVRTQRASTDAAEVRAWAVAQGYDVPARGRIPNDVRAAFEAAQG